MPTGEGGELTQEEQREGGAISGEILVLQKVLSYTLFLELLDSHAKSQCIGLCEEIGHQLLMIRHGLSINLDWVLRLCVPDELSGDHPALVHQLVETVLSIGTGLTKDDGASFDSRTQADAVTGDTLAIAFHI